MLALNPQIRNANIVRSGQQVVLPDGSDRSAMLAALARETAGATDPLWLALALREENAGVREYEPGSNSACRIYRHLDGLTGDDRTTTRPGAPPSNQLVLIEAGGRHKFAWRSMEGVGARCRPPRGTLA